MEGVVAFSNGPADKPDSGWKNSDNKERLSACSHDGESRHSG